MQDIIIDNNQNLQSNLPSFSKNQHQLDQNKVKPEYDVKISNEPKREMSAAEKALFERKRIDFRLMSFPEINPIDYFVPENGKMVRIQNYRYPCQLQERKGIIIYYHGYGDYCGKYAYYAKIFAEAGFDFCGMDQKGFGHSEGTRAYMTTEEDLLTHFLDYVELIDEKYGGSDVKKYLMGYSMGGLYSSYISEIRPKLFEKIIIMAPGLKLADDWLYDNIRGELNELYKTNPMMVLPHPRSVKELPWYLKDPWEKDPFDEAKFVFLSNYFIVCDISRKAFMKENLEKISTPIMMILGAQEELVNNEVAEEFFKKIPHNNKELVVIDGLSHSLFHDKEYLPLVTKTIIDWILY